MPDELAEHLEALARDDCYRVDAVLKDGALEITQRVFFVGANGAEQGPYVRKYLDSDAGLGAAYERIWKAQRSGRRFLHVPRIVDCYMAGEQRAVVMEYVQGETLADVVYRCDPSIELACDVFPRLCDAVSELHDGFDPPIIHRDLKPSNVMLTRDNLTIIDFGIARSFDEGAEEDTRRFGTRAYAPPEQFGFGQTDVRSDVYALGMLLYFCLTEKTPDAKVRNARFVSAQVPEPLRHVIVRATSFDPEARYASIAELRAGFAEATGAVQQPVVEKPRYASAPTGLRTKGESRRNLLSRIPRVVGIVWDVLLALAFVLFLVASVGTTFWPVAGSAVAGYTVQYRAVVYLVFSFLLVGPVLYLLSDRRPLDRFRRGARPSFARELVAVLLIVLLGFVVFGFLSSTSF